MNSFSLNKYPNTSTYTDLVARRHWLIVFIFQYYAQFDLQGSDNHKDLYDSLKKWVHERKMQPDVSLTISVGDPIGGPDDTQNFLADPFHVSSKSKISLKNIHLFNVFIILHNVSKYEVNISLYNNLFFNNMQNIPIYHI